MSGEGWIIKRTSSWAANYIDNLLPWQKVQKQHAWHSLFRRLVKKLDVGKK
jgi:hypothetical protein